MAKIYNSITELIGNTPLLRLNNFKQQNNLKADLIGKVEFFNEESEKTEALVEAINQLKKSLDN